MSLNRLAGEAPRLKHACRVSRETETLFLSIHVGRGRLSLASPAEGGAGGAPLRRLQQAVSSRRWSAGRLLGAGATVARLWVATARRAARAWYKADAAATGAVSGEGQLCQECCAQRQQREDPGQVHPDIGRALEVLPSSTRAHAVGVGSHRCCRHHRHRRHQGLGRSINQVCGDNSTPMQNIDLVEGLVKVYTTFADNKRH